jgi:nucleoid-associated protein YgaU
MTKEIKLSLIFGFALVLVVGVLLSDHLSGARQATLDGVNPTAGVPAPVASTNSDPSAVPPLVLVGEDGRPQPRQAQPAQVQPQHAAFAEGGTQVHAIPVSAVSEPQEAFVERLRQKMSSGLTGAVNDLQEGNVPLGAFALDGPAEQPPVTDQVDEPSLAHEDVVPQPSDPVIQETRKVASDEFRLYTVKEGDTLWSLASRLLGDGRRHKELAELNRDRIGGDGQLRVGASIKIPTGSAKAQRSESKPAETKPKADRASKKDDDNRLASNGKPRKYEVKSGDTLSRIAARMLGSAGRADDILLANAGVLSDEDSLEVGMSLDIPAR